METSERRLQFGSRQSASEGQRGGRGALQHVIVALLVVVISVEIQIRTVIGGCYQGEGPVVVVGVQRFLLNADVMPGGRGTYESPPLPPPPPPPPPPLLFFPLSLITFHMFRNKKEPILFLTKGNAGTKVRVTLVRRAFQLPLEGFQPGLLVPRQTDNRVFTER